MMRLGLILVFLLAVLNAKPVVSATILPVEYFIEQIGSNSVEITTIVKANADPHSFEPKVSDMKKLEFSDLFFAVGIEYEGVWLPKFSKAYPNLKIINTQANAHMPQDHDNHDGHDHEEFDTHIWLDPIMVKDQAKIIAQALSDEYPQNSQIYSQNLDKFNQEIDKLDSYIKDS